MIPRISAPSLSSSSEDDEKDDKVSAPGSSSCRSNFLTKLQKKTSRDSIGSSSSRRQSLLHQTNETESPSRQLRSMSVAVPSGAGAGSLLPMPSSQQLHGNSGSGSRGSNAGPVQGPMNPRSRTNSLPNPAFLLDFSGYRDPRTCVSVR